MKKSNVFNGQPPVDLRRANRRLVRRIRRDSRFFAAPAYDSKKLSNSFPPQWPETDLLPTLALASRDPVPLDGDKTIYIEPHTPAAPAAITSISRELVRCHFEELLANLADPSFDVDARIQGLHSDLDDFQRELRERDLSRATLLANAAAEKVGERPVSEMDAGATRQFATTVKACWQAELKAHEEFEDPLRVASDLLGRFQISPKNGLIPPFVSVSTAVETAMTSKSEEMRRKLSATGKLLLEHFGDIALELVPQRIVEFARFLHRLPRDHGQKHGMNRYTDECVAPTKHEIIRLADDHDAGCYAKVHALATTSDRQKLAMLPDMLTIRMTQTNLERHLDRVHEILRAAAKHLGYAGETKALTYAELKDEMKRFDEELRAVEPLFLRMTRPKTRSRWSGVRLKKLLTSPVYRGCFSGSRRTRPGKTLIQDAIYWVPLIVMCMGTRMTEVLQLKSGDLIWHDDGVYCLRMSWSVEQKGKTFSSRRIVPIPQVLLDLGLVDWIKRKSHDPNALLFPEIFKRNPKHTDQTFTKRFWTVRKNLELLDHSEDFYALRMSLSSALWRGGVSESDRQMIIGHASKTIIAKHYTYPDMKVLKAKLDLADFKLKIFQSRVHGVPVIGDCGMISGVPANVEVILDADGSVGGLRVVNDANGEQLAAVIISSSSISRPPNWRSVERRNRERAAQMVHDLSTEYALMPPSNSAQAEAFESFMAFRAETAN